CDHPRHRVKAACRLVIQRANDPIHVARAPDRSATHSPAICRLLPDCRANRQSKSQANTSNLARPREVACKRWLTTRVVPLSGRDRARVRPVAPILRLAFAAVAKFRCKPAEAWATTKA